ncbi:MAG TPA: hypothetical protein VN803_13145, partial [Gemmatimonadales bacterium]|nr:hypothetical protein [Gemmatimonadales bacterium]
MNGDLRWPVVLVALLGIATSIGLAVGPIAEVRLPGAPPTDSRMSATASLRPISAESVAAIVSRDPFRIGRRPALPAYDPLRLAEQQAPPPARPTLVLVGVMDAASPSAVIEGFPGVDGARVVRVGDVVSGLAIKKVGSGRVVVTGMDTT